MGMRFTETTRSRSSGPTTPAERAPHSPSATRAARRLEHVSNVARLLAGSGTLDEVFEEALTAVAGVVPIDGAILIQEDSGGRGISVWPARGEGPSLVALAHAEGALASLARGAPDWTERPGTFFIFPLVVAGRPGFGVLQLEAEAVDGPDLLFVNAVASQFAVALDRDRAWRQVETERIRSQETEMLLQVQPDWRRAT